MFWYSEIVLLFHPPTIVKALCMGVYKTVETIVGRGGNEGNCYKNKCLGTAR